jgi:ligand-binding SRPBCC domain-containing protein
MFIVRESVLIHAPIERVFLLSTRIELVKETLGMNPVGGVTSGHIAAGSRVHWRGWKFGLPTEHHTLITAFIPPHEHLSRVDHHPITTEAFFQDTQERGRFSFFQHDHRFYESTDPSTGTAITELKDEVRFALPFGPIGRIAAKLLLLPHVRKLCQKRFARLKQLAESEGWREFVREFVDDSL